MRFDYKFPDLSNLKEVSVLFFAKHFFQGGGPKEYNAYALTMNFIRLVDLSVQEYELGRSSFQEFLNNREGIHIGSATASVGHFEVCLSALKRSVNFLKALRGNKNVQNGLKNLLPRGSLILRGDAEKQVTRMRHAIEHLEEEIIKGQIQKGQALCVLATEEKLELGCHSIRYTDLAAWLTELHTLSGKLPLYSESYPNDPASAIG